MAKYGGEKSTASFIFTVVQLVAVQILSTHKGELVYLWLKDSRSKRSFEEKLGIYEHGLPAYRLW